MRVYIRGTITLSSRGGYRPCERFNFTRSNCLIYIKSGIGKYGKEIVEKSGKLSSKSGKIGA